MTRSILAILMLLTTVFAAPGSAQSLNVVDELKACAKITARDARYACFDNLGERLLREESADEEPTAQKVAQPAAMATPAATSAQSSPDEIAVEEQVAQPAAAVTPAATATRPPADNVPTRSLRNEQQPVSPVYSVKITSCKKGYYGDWYFILDDGQVWKEISRRKLKFEDCDFNATISRDSFGYKLSTDALGKPIRVKRHK